MVEGVMTAVYQTICTQVIMMTMIATVMETVQKIGEIITPQKLPEISEENQIGFDEIEEKPGNFVDIEGVGRVRIDENGSVILDNTAPLDAGKKIAIKTERNIIVDSLKCEGLIADAPSVVIKGESEIKSIDVSVAKNFVIAEGASLNFENAKINGRVANYGILNFRFPNSKILMNGGNFWNYGTMSGREIGVENFGNFRNFGKIDGENLNFQGNALKNSGTIGSSESNLNFVLYKSLINEHNAVIVGRHGHFVLTGDDDGLKNEGLLSIHEADFQIAGILENSGRGIFEKIDGAVQIFLNSGEFKANRGDFSVNSGENRHILKLGTLRSSGEFFNFFTDESSKMQLNSLLGAGKFFNKSAFSLAETTAGGIGIRAFQNDNLDFVRRFGVASFGNTVRFLNTLTSFKNKGVVHAESLCFSGSNIKINNSRNGVIKTTGSIGGTIGELENSGTIFSGNSFISLIFQKIINFNVLAALSGVKLVGETLVNYANLAISKSVIGTLTNAVRAKLWSYFGSKVTRLENNGHVEYIKGLHKIETYAGGENSELLLPKFQEDDLPDYQVGDRNIAEELGGTKVTYGQVSGTGAIKAEKTEIRGPLSNLKNFALHGNIEAHVSSLPTSIPTFSGTFSLLAKMWGFTNSSIVKIPGVRIVMDLMGQNFSNSGSIACKELEVKNCDIFKNSNAIETAGDIKVNARKIQNECSPGSFMVRFRPRLPQSISEWILDYSINKVGNGYIRSHTGSITLNGRELVSNRYSSIIAAKTFNLSSSYGSVINHVGDIAAFGSGKSYITADYFENSCDGIGSFSRSRPGLEGWTQHIKHTYNQSRKAKIHAAGDLYLNVSRAPVIRGSDLTSGRILHCNFPLQGSANVQQVFRLSPVVAAYQTVTVNGRDLGLKGALFLAGYGITMDMSGNVTIINPKGNRTVIPPRGALNISVRELVRRFHTPVILNPLLPLETDMDYTYRMLLDPTNGMRRLFLGHRPDPTKPVVFDTALLSAIPMVMMDMLPIFGIEALNPRKLLEIMSANAEEVDENGIIKPSDLPNKSLLYFEYVERNGMQYAEPYFHVTAETLRRALEAISHQGVLCLYGPVRMRAHNMLLERAHIQGTEVELTALRDDTISRAATITATASTIEATDQVAIHADDGTQTHAEFEVSEHRTEGHRQYTRIQTTEITPSRIAGGERITISGGPSELRGTLIGTRELVDQTENLLIGADKQRLEYESYKKKKRWYGSRSIHHTGSYEILAPSSIEAERMLSTGEGSLELESIIGKLERLEVYRPTFRESAATVESEDKVETSSHGIHFHKGSIEDPLVESWRNLIHSHNMKAQIGSAITSAAKIIGTLEDAKDVMRGLALGMSAPGMSLVAGTLGKRLVNVGFSVGSSSTSSVTRESHQIPNQIKADLIRLDCPVEVRLQGHHDVHEMDVRTESFKAVDMVSTREVHVESESSGISVNPVNMIASGLMSAAGVAVGGGSVLAGASSASSSSSSVHTRQVTHEASTVNADRFILRAGNAHLTDTQIRARLVDAIVRDDLILESLCDEFFSESDGGSFGMGFGFLNLVKGVQTVRDTLDALGGTSAAFVKSQEIEKKINAFAELVGEEHFNLVVGGQFIRKEQQEERRKRDHSFTVPLGDLLTIASKLNERQALAKEVYQKEKSEGKSDAEAMQVVTAVSKVADEVAVPI